MAHQIGAPGLVKNAFRAILGMLDEAVYSLISNIYKVFFYVSSSTIIGGDVVKLFFQRIQLILGIFMIFKLAISLLNLIINPDLIKDKNAGTGKIVMRVILCLLMLTLIVPLNIPNAANKTSQGYTSFNGFINDNGILFGTLYAIQDRVLRENVLAKLILGYNPPEQDSNQVPNTNIGSLDNAGNMLAVSVLKSFVLVNVHDDSVEDICNGDDENCENVYCVAEIQNSGYLDENAGVGTIVNALTETCDSGGVEYYALAYYPVISTIVGAVLAIILIGYTVDIAIRALKLAALRLVAPIPIISYVDPKASKDGAFASWTKTLTTTYIDLFLRLAIIYFAIFVIASVRQDGVYIAPGATGGVRVFSYVFIVIGILFFVKQAPQFIKTMLGAKGVGFGPGVSGALGFLGGVVAGGGISGAMAGAITTANATNEAQAQGKQGPSAWSTGRDLVTKMRTGDDKATGGLLNRFQRTATTNAQQRNRVAQQRHARTLLAREYGITAQGLEQKKFEMITEQNRAEAMEAAQRAGTTTYKYTDKNGVMHTGTFASANVTDQLEEIARTKSNAIKLKTDYESGAKIAEKNKLDQTKEEKYRASARERLSRAAHYARHPFATHANEMYDHQSVGDRLSGSNKWH